MKYIDEGGVWMETAKVTVDTLGEALMVSALGLSTVFITLVSLALAVLLVSVVLRALGIGKETKQEAPVNTAPQAPKEELDGELYAAIVAAISEEMGLPVDRFQIVSIQESV